MSAPWPLFLLWGVVGLGSGCVAAVFASTVVSRWFVARRALVTGVLTAATASGQLVFLPLLSRLAEDIGWRWIGVTIALSALAVIPIGAPFLRDRPEDVIDPALAMGGAGLAGFMVFYGLGWVATVPPTVALCTDGFGTTRGPLVFGWLFAVISWAPRSPHGAPASCVTSPGPAARRSSSPASAVSSPPPV